MHQRMWWTIGWRNLGRNKRRTVITATALAGGFFSVVVLVGLGEGMIAEMIGSGTGLVTGQLQVHSSEYLPERSVYETIGGGDGVDVSLLLDRIEADPAIDAAAPRVFGGGLVSGGPATVASIFVGIDPEREPRVALVATSIREGRLPALGANEVAVGAEISRRLELGVGDEVVLVAPAADGSLGNDLFIISGVFATGLAELDAAYTLLPIDILQALIVLPPDRVHEIAAKIGDPWLAPEAAVRLQAAFAADGFETDVQSWTTMRPEMVDYARLMDASQWILIAVIFGMAIFGVANTMVMAAYERRKEFALLLALGAVPWGIVRSVLAEAFALGVLSLVAGGVITFPVLVWWNVAPLDLSRFLGDVTIIGALIRPVFRTEYPWETIAWASLSLFVTALIAAAYPAFRAARLPPADTLADR